MVASDQRGRLALKGAHLTAHGKTFISKSCGNGIDFVIVEIGPCPRDSDGVRHDVTVCFIERTLRVFGTNGLELRSRERASGRLGCAPGGRV